jgi:hypothetical protein
MKRCLTACLLGLCLLAPTAASAQYYGYSAHKLELNVMGGYTWTFSRQVYNAVGAYQTMDVKDNPYWGLALDVNLQRGGQLEFLFRREDSELTLQQFSSGPKTTLADVALQYWQVGGLGGYMNGNVFPFGFISLGATQIIFKNSDLSDDWRFSMIFGLGAKYYTTGRFGLRVQANLPFTFVSGGGGFACGPGGCYSTVGGTGVGQFDIGGGIFMGF